MAAGTGLSGRIGLERVVLEETPDAYRAQYGTETYEIAKDNKSHFSGAGAQGIRIRQEMRTEMRISPAHGIFQDEEMPAEFKEVSIFHEIREREYSQAGFDDAHERAVNDEILYVQKYFSEELQQRYFDFADEYREKAGRKAFFEELEHLDVSRAKYQLPKESFPEDYQTLNRLFSAGQALDTKDFSRHTPYVREALDEWCGKYPLFAYVVGSRWPDKHYKEIEELVCRHIARGPENVFRDVFQNWDWSQPREKKLALETMALQNPARCSLLSEYWVSEEFWKHAERIIRIVQKDPAALQEAQKRVLGIQPPGGNRYTLRSALFFQGALGLMSKYGRRDDGGLPGFCSRASIEELDELRPAIFVMMSPRTGYELGKKLSDEAFTRYKGDLLNVLLRPSQTTARLKAIVACAKSWPAERFLSMGPRLMRELMRTHETKRLLNGLLRERKLSLRAFFSMTLEEGSAIDPSLAYEIGRDCSEQDFNSSTDLLTNAVARNPQSSYYAGKSWNDERFNPYAELFARAVATDLEQSFLAGKYWKDERFNPYAELFARRVATDPNESYAAGLDWRYKRFKPFGELFARSAANCPDIKYWEKNRKKFLP